MSVSTTTVRYLLSFDHDASLKQTGLRPRHTEIYLIIQLQHEEQVLQDVSVLSATDQLDIFAGSNTGKYGDWFTPASFVPKVAGARTV